MSPRPLEGNAKRQAMDSMLGYDYQIWRTVEAWMRLAPDETLYLECAEDFDVVGNSGASMAQIKNSPTPITINSADVKEAIKNFWAAQIKNADRGDICLRFLTRGEVGLERDRPFEDKKGLDLWRLAAGGDGAIARKLADHLMATLEGPSLLEFLEGATPEELVGRLFGRIEWVTGEPSIEAVQLAVRRLAGRLGKSQNVTAQASHGAVDTLLAYCRKVAVEKNSELRSLTAEDLRLVFEQGTSLAIPITGDLLAALSLAITPRTAATSFTLSLADGTLPTLPDPHLPRPEFAEIVASQLVEPRVVLIVGSEGRGKTTTANIVGHKVAGRVHWMDLSALSDERSASQAIENVLLLVRGAAPPRCVILDDVPAAQGISDEIWVALRALMDSCRQFGTALLLTAKGVSEEAVDSKFRAARVAVLPVPVLSQEEVEHFFSALGCPPAKVAGWAKLTLLHSGNGHPKLVYLRGLELQDAGWPAVGSDALVAPRSIEEARANTRQVAAKVVADSDRPLLYTLSLTSISFDRSLALRVGTLLSMALPGESFDRLAGRWIEHREPGRFSVTTMLNGQAQQIWGAEKIALSHRLLFDAFIDAKTVRATDAMGLFLHAFAGKDSKRLRGFLSIVLQDGLDNPTGLAGALEALIFVGSESSSFAVPFDRQCSLLLRIIQFRIVKACRIEMLSDIVESWAWEIDQIPLESERQAAAVIRGLSIACTMDGELAPSVAINAIRDAAHHEKMGLLLPNPDLGLEFTAPRFAKVTVIAWLFVAAQTRCQTAKDLDGFVDALDALDEGVRSRMLEAFALPYARLGVSMAERIWLAEAKRTEPDWLSVIEALERCGAFAARWGCEGLSVAVAKTLSLIYDEELKDSNHALTLLKTSPFHGVSGVLKAQEANVLFRAEKFDGALDLWREIFRDGINTREIAENIEDRFPMRRAAIAAGKLGIFDEAAHWMERAASIDSHGPKDIPAAAFHLEAAYCWFKHGDLLRALSALVKGVVRLKVDYDHAMHFFEFAAQKNAGSLASWLLGRCRKWDWGTEPCVGGMTMADMDRTAYQNSPPSPYVFAAWMILEVSHLLDIDLPELDELRIDLGNTEFAIPGSQFRILELKRAFERRAADDLAICIYHMQIAVWKSQWVVSAKDGANGKFATEIQREPPSSNLTEKAWMLMLGLALTTLEGGRPEVLANRWISQLNGLPYGEEFQVEIESSLAYFDVELTFASSKMQTRPMGLANIGVAARLLSSDLRRPIDTAYAQVTLLFLFQKTTGAIFESSLGQFFDLFSAHWRRHIDAPALLLSPRVTVPMLEGAIGDTGPIAQRFLKLLRAISAASSLTLPQELIDGFETLSRTRKNLDSLRSR